MRLLCLVMLFLLMGQVEGFTGYKIHFSNNTTDEAIIQDLLNTSNFTRPYEAGVFDCVEMSIETSRFLEENGYTARPMTTPDMTHAYVVVKRDKCWVIVEATAEPSQTMGVVVKNGIFKEYSDYGVGFIMNNETDFRTHINRAVNI